MTVKQFCKENGIECKEEGEHLTVGGYLDLRGTGITKLPEHLTVGGSLYLRGTGITDKQAEYVNRSAPTVISWQGGKYISVDDIFCEVISRKGCVYKCRKIAQKNTFFVVVIDGKAAHGDTIREAREDLLYKIANRDTSKYAGMRLSDTVTHAEAIEMYRVITGACAFGTKDYVENRIPKKKARYTIGEIITMTKGEYGNDRLAAFFGVAQ
jgi:hypothetical protein